MRNIKILIVEDDASYRAFLVSALKEMGYDSVCAEDGVEALNILNTAPINFIISDWIMPRMDGVELCKAIRLARFDKYIYFIMLTVKTDKMDLVRGMNSGADEYIVKSYETEELEVYIRAGVRILNLEQTLEEKSKRLDKLNCELNLAYAQTRSDLIAASEIQKCLLPKPQTLENFRFEWIFSPCSYVAGDIFNYFILDENHLGFYLLDVSGHGIPASLLSVSLNQMLSPNNDFGVLVKSMNSNGGYDITPPNQVLEKLNNRFQMDGNNIQDHYLTMVYGLININTNEMELAIAGHPPPLWITESGGCYLKRGGYPIGWVPKTKYEIQRIRLNPGDRLVIFSDGVSQCFSPSKEFIPDEMLRDFFLANHTLDIKKTLSRLKDNILAMKKEECIEDDISLIAIEYKRILSTKPKVLSHC